MLNIVLLITSICVVVGLILYLFFLNRVVAFILGLILRLTFWNQAESSIWVDIGSIQFSILTGRILFKDVRYHSSNQTIRIVKGQISWRYWIRRPAAEEDLSHAHVVGEDATYKEHPPLTCRVHLSLQGFEWFIYNRTAAYDNIVAQMQDDLPPTPAPTPAVPSVNFDARDAMRKIFSRTSAHLDSSVLGPTTTSQMSSIYHKAPGFVQRALFWLKLQLPNFDPKNLLPMGIEVTKGAIICGNASTLSLLVAEFHKAEGTYGIVQARSKHDLYKQLFNIKFRNASLSYCENTDFHDHMSDIGWKVHEHIKEARTPPIRQSTYLSFTSFQKLWTRLKLWSVASTSHSRIRALFTYPSVPVPHPPAAWGWRKAHKSLDDETPVGIDFSGLEYSIERKILEAPVLEVLYYADVVGIVPLEPQHPQNNAGSLDPFDIGNTDLPPEWGMDIVVKGGFLRYGPWADRQRVILQQCFFPRMFHDMEPTVPLKPGDMRMWTALKIFIELQDGVTLHIPFREASKDWQWDGKVDVPNRPRKREPASIHLKAGDNSTISYILPMVVTKSGYQPSLEVHLDTVTVTSSLNDIRLVTAESCRVRGQLPTPLKWNGERQWTFAVSLRQSSIYLLRDHITMLTDLSKDWNSGPATDYYRFIPMIYAIDFDMQHYEINTYVNDHNIIDKPLIKEDNALLTLRGAYFKSGVRMPQLQYRPESAAVSFWIEIPDVTVHLTLPRWNTYSLFSEPDRTSVGRIGHLVLNGSYQYYTDVREENIDLLKMDFTICDIVYKAFGWTVRHFMILRDNYFGSFTHFSTLFEYLEKRRKGQPVGDPIDLQYRPGKSNCMEVEVGLEITRGLIAVPAGLPGYEVFDAEISKSTASGDLGSSLILNVPVIQVQLRTNDFFMEMSMNVDHIFGRVEEHCSDQCLNTSYRGLLENIVFDGLHITANRLFGPQPHTTTYVCIWEIQLENLKASLTTYQTKLLLAIGSSFAFNFSDPLNAPAKEFAIPTDPDITFLKVTLRTANMVWLEGRSAIELILPEGVRIDSNDLAGQFHRKVLSIRLPLADIKALVKSEGPTGIWFEASQIMFDAFMDIYSAPPGWQKSAQEQREFVRAQDMLTQRAKALYSSSPDDSENASGNGLIDIDLYLPQLRVPSRINIPSYRNGPVNRMTQSRFHTNRSPSTFQSESDADEGLLEADRDARLANSRPIGVSDTPWRGIDDDSIMSGDESDDEELTDPLDWESDGSDISDDPLPQSTWPSIAQYKAQTTQYIGRSPAQPLLWDGSPFVLTGGRGTTAKDDFEDQNETTNIECTLPTPDITSLHHPVDHDVTVIRILCSRGIVVDLTPLIVHIAQDFLKNDMSDVLSPELRVDAFLIDFTVTAAAKGAQISPRVVVVDGFIPFIRLKSTQVIASSSATTKQHTQMAESRRNTASAFMFKVANLRLNLRQLSGVTDGTGQSALSFLWRQISAELQPVQGWLLPNQATSIECPKFRITMGHSSGRITHRETLISLGRLEAELDHSAPDAVLAGVGIVLQYVGGIMDRWMSSIGSAPDLDRQLITRTLQYSRQRTIIDPLSTIQPSYLVQKGDPDSLRRSSGFKFLIYTRSCLRYLESTERHAILDLKPGSPQRIVLQDFMDLLGNHFNQGLEDDISGLSQQPFLQQLFSSRDGIAEEQKNANNAIFPGMISLRTTGMRLTIHHPTNNVRSQFSIDAMVVALNTKSTAFRQAALPNLGKSHPHLSLHQTETCHLRHVVISISIGPVRLSIFPQLMEFLQVILRSTRSHSASLSRWRTGVPVQHAQSMSGRTIIRLPDNLYADIVLRIHSLCITAAADNLVVSLSVSRVTSLSSLLAMTFLDQAKPRTSLNQNIQLGYASLRLCSAKDTSKSPDGNILAILAVKNTRLSGIVSGVGSVVGAARTAVHIGAVEFHLPRSALRLYRFMEEWTADYLPGIKNAVLALLSEIHPEQQESVPPAEISISSQPSHVPVIQIQVTVSVFTVHLQLMLGTWLYWRTGQTILYMTSIDQVHPSIPYSFGLQVGTHLVEISTKIQGDAHSPSSACIQLQLPVIALKGQYNDSGLHGLALVEFFDLLIKSSDWDTLLSVRQKSGQDFYDFLRLIEESRSAKTASAHVKPTGISGTFKLNGAARMKGFRIGVEGHASTMFLECDDISGSIDNKEDLAWQFQLSDLSLSLASSARAREALDRGRRSAFVTVDLQANMRRRRRASEGHLLQVAVTKVHAVMQPTSIGEFGDFVDHLQAVVLVRQEDRANELAHFKEKTKSIMRSIDVKMGETEDPDSSWLHDCSISMIIKNIGFAFPLAGNTDLQIPRSRSYSETVAVRAFLFSIKSLAFGTHHDESGQASMKDFSFQFVQSFRQSVAVDFAGDSHQTRNRLLYPETTAHVRAEGMSGSRRLRIRADVSGFVLDLDSSISDYVFSLMDVYRQGRERMERFANSTPKGPINAEIETLLPIPSVESQYSPLPTSNIFLSATFASGRVRMHSIRSQPDSPRRRFHSHERRFTLEHFDEPAVEVFDLPMVSVWGEYRATPAFHKFAGSSHDTEPSTLLFKSTIHSSQNTLRPTLLPFITELVARIEDRLRQSSRPNSQISSLRTQDLISAVSPEQIQEQVVDHVSGMKISLSLRIDQSKLELTCQPDVNVVAGLHWDSGGFMVNISPGARQVTFTGSVGGLTVGLKHGFLSEDCVKLDARNLAFNVAFTKMQSDMEKNSNTISVVVDTEFLGGVRFSRLQDVLCFKAVWLDRIPMLSGQTSDTADTMKTRYDLAERPTTSSEALNTAVIMRFRSIQIDADLGQSISLVKLDMHNVLLRTRINDTASELGLFVSELTLLATGNLSGRITVPDFRFHTLRNHRIGGFDISGGRMLDLIITTGVFSIELDSEYQKLIQYRAEPIEVKIFDDWIMNSRVAKDGRHVNVAFTVSGSNVVIIMNVSTIPKLVSYANKFRLTLENQREGASRESKAFRIANSPKPDNPLSAVANAMLMSTRNRLKEEGNHAYAIGQYMSLKLELLQLVVFPRSMRDLELAQFVGRQVHAQLDRLVGPNALPARRDLQLSFSSITTSRLSQLNHAALAKESVDGTKEWLAVLTRASHEATIFGLPAMDIQMRSEEFEQGQRKVLRYDFSSKFADKKGSRDTEEIYITLNMSLYSWLTSLRKAFAREMEQVQASGDVRSAISTLAQQTSASRKRGNDSVALLPEKPTDDRGTDLDRGAAQPESSAGHSSKRPASHPPPSSPLKPPAMPISPSKSLVQSPSGISDTALYSFISKSASLTYEPVDRQIERLTMRQLGEATPDVMHPFFMKKAGFSLEDSLPQYVHEYATMPTEEIMKALLKVYSKQLNSVHEESIPSR